MLTHDKVNASAEVQNREGIKYNDRWKATKTHRPDYQTAGGGPQMEPTSVRHPSTWRTGLIATCIMYHVKVFTVCVVPILYPFNFRLQMSVLRIREIFVQTTNDLATRTFL
jgi:hypothetical protein